MNIPKNVIPKSIVKDYKGLKYADVDNDTVLSGSRDLVTRLRYDNKNRLTSVTSKLAYMDIHYDHNMTTVVAINRVQLHFFKPNSKILFRLVKGVIKSITVNDVIINEIKHNPVTNEYSFILGEDKYSFEVSLAVDILLLYKVYKNNVIVALFDIAESDKDSITVIRSKYDIIGREITPSDCIVEKYEYKIEEGTIQNYTITDIETNTKETYAYKYAKDCPDGVDINEGECHYFVDIRPI